MPIQLDFLVFFVSVACIYIAAGAIDFDPITLMCGIIYWLLIQHTVSMEQLYGGIHRQEGLIIPIVLTVGQR